MKRLYGLLLIALVAVMLPGAPARAGVADYKFTDTYGDQIFPDGKPTEISFTGGLNGNDDNSYGFTPKVATGDPAFTFYLAGKAYTRFSVSTNGLIGLGSTDITACWDNFLNVVHPSLGCGGSYALTLGSGTPQIAPLWNDLRVPGDYKGDPTGSVSYFINGTAPNRILVFDFTNIEIVYKYQIFGTWQVRLYEGSNRIEFWYSDIAVDFLDSQAKGASIGIASDTLDFLSVTPGGSGGARGQKNGPSTAGVTGATVSSTEANDNVDYTYSGTPIYYGTLYIFDPCNIQVIGDPSQGGTVLMGDGDKLLDKVSQQVWTNTTYKPYSIYLNPDPCSDRQYTYTISGNYPGDYSISPTNGTIGADSKLTPTLTFTPKGIGARPATLTVTDDNGFSRTFDLAGEGTTRIKWTGNPAQGGVDPPTDGTTFVDGTRVLRLATQDFTPLTIQNFNNNGAAPAAPTSYLIDDPTGQYRLVDPATGDLVEEYSLDLTANQSSTPIIRFHATGVGFQPATFTVTAEGETRTYKLNAYSVAAGGEFYLGTVKLGPKEQVFQKDYVCAGEYIQTYEITVKNVGDGDFNILGATAYLTDTLYSQGVPSYPLLRDEFGNAIPATDYFISDYPGVAPASANPTDIFPISVPEKGERKIYINYVPQKPGKRFARIYLRTNGANFLGTTPEGLEEDGLLTFDLFGRALGSRLSIERDNDVQPKAVSFPNTPVNSSSDVSLRFYNAGACDLRIERKKFRIVGGDVRDFKILEAFMANVLDQNTDTYVVPPGDSIDIKMRFTPSRTGSRRATVMLQTNDSTIITPGLTERGAIYWNLLGTGSAGLVVHDPVFAPGIIDGPASEQPSATAVLENQLREPVIIDSMQIVGTDVAEFSMDPANPWPTTPFAIKPGELLSLMVDHAPAPGSPVGSRTASLLLFSGVDTIFVPLNGIAGSRLLTVSPGSLFDNASVLVGKSAFETVMITNNGTLPLRLGQTTISGPNANDYILGILPRLMLAPGQTEFLEIRYRPVGQGASTATLTISGNETNGPQTVMLGGIGKGIGPVGTPGAVSGVGSTEDISGTNLWQSVPNPARNIVEIRYRLANDADVQLKLYDLNGREIATLDRGSRESGEHTVSFRVDDLAAGVYHYRLTADGTVLSRSLTVVK